MSFGGHHHIKKDLHSEEEIEIRKVKQKEKIEKFLSLKDEVYSCRKNLQKTDDALELTSEYLHHAPDDYSIWNYRELILKYLTNTELGVSPETADKYFRDEISFVRGIFGSNTKSYSVVNHWRWLLLQIPSPDWNGELKLIEALLDLDGRNFHCWDARRYVVSISNMFSPMNEVAYAGRKIEQDFSNYSAWHYRATKIGEAFPDKREREEFIRKDLKYVWSAIYVDPDDQSAWLYFRHIMSYLDSDSKRDELDKVKEFLDIEPNSKYAIIALLELSNDLHVKEPMDHQTYQSFIHKLINKDPFRKNRYLRLTQKLGLDTLAVKNIVID